MKIFAYEYLTANALGRSPESADHHMYLEGRAMRDAVVEDFRRVPGATVFSFPDDDAPIPPQRFEEACRTADWTLVIAPAFDGCLGRLAEMVEIVGGRLLGPSLDAIRLTSDKFALFNRWRTHRITTPATTDRVPSPCEAFPVVWKPRDGAGSTMTFLLRSANDVVRAQSQLASEHFRGPMILQEYVPGLAASVAFVCGPTGNVPLAPAVQVLSDDGRFSYCGGELPLSHHLASRVVKLAQRAVDCIPGLKGYVGVDLVLGDYPDGSRDYAIEINPRLTTSYLGLRALADFNLAEAMWLAATSRRLGPLKWKAGAVRFDSNGTIHHTA